jgi:excisionase family DNA binding protein
MQELFTVKEVAEKLKISVSSVYRYVENGLLPHKKLGVNVRFTEEHITAFLAGKQNLTKRDSVAQMGGLASFYDQW